LVESACNNIKTVTVKFLENILHKMEPKFIKGGKLEKWNPLFETLATFAFTPKLVTTKGSHIRDGVDLKRTMMTVIMALIPCLLFGIYNTGHWAMVAESGSRDLVYWADQGTKIMLGLKVVLPLLVVSYGVGLLIEFIFGMLRGHSLHEGFLVSGMLIPLTMPADVPLWMVGVATAFAVIIGKEVFGGTGMNIVNVALTARAFLFFAYPTSMSGDKVWLAGNEIDGVSGSTALGDLASFMSDKPVFENLDAYTNNYSLMDSFMGMIPGSIGETSTLAFDWSCNSCFNRSWFIENYAFVLCWRFSNGSIIKHDWWKSLLGFASVFPFSNWWFCFWCYIHGNRSSNSCSNGNRKNILRFLRWFIGNINSCVESSLSRRGNVGNFVHECNSTYH
jgi:hypothetical protein